jgi:nucleoside-diphosphate kinase
MERTLVLIKPDGIVRQVTGKIISRFEDAGLKMVGMKMVWVDENLAKKHYREDIAKKYGDKIRNSLIEYVREGPIIAIVLEGVDAIKVTRKIVGSTYPNESQPGTIRGDFAHISKHFANSEEMNVRNLIHASGDEDDAKIEVSLWFNEKEMHTYQTVHDMICFKK